MLQALPFTALVLRISLGMAFNILPQHVVEKWKENSYQGPEGYWVPGRFGPLGPIGPKGDRGPVGERGPRGEWVGEKEFQLLKLEIRDVQNQLKTLSATVERIQNAHRLESGMDKIFSSNGSVGTFETARETCSLAGGQLASPKNPAENVAIKKIVQKYDRSAFLGINDRHGEGIFQYLNGETAWYFNWVSGEPNAMGRRNEDCINMYETGKWSNIPCESHQLVICEF